MTSLLRRLNVRTRRGLEFAADVWAEINWPWSGFIRRRTYWARRFGRYAQYLQTKPDAQFGDTISAPDLEELYTILWWRRFLPTERGAIVRRLYLTAGPWRDKQEYVQYTTTARETCELAAMFGFFKPKDL
jgi:hypothetical protein